MNAKYLLFTALALPLAAQAFDRRDAQLALTQAGTAIESAERADAAQFATNDLAEAHDMFASAQGAYDARRWTDTIFLAENAKADADLASARSRESRAEAATAEVERSVRTLRDELRMPEGEQP